MQINYNHDWRSSRRQDYDDFVVCALCNVQCIGGVVVQRGNQDRLLSGHDASESLSHCSVFGQSTYNSFYIHSTLFFKDKSNKQTVLSLNTYSFGLVSRTKKKWYIIKY